ncbi:MAG TPA: class D sortase [Gammaproteobacteria bacterium]|nr:class D sortase [Gammaproteobacteria bacterium]
MTDGSISRALETVCWVLGIALIVLYFGARAYGEIERRQAIATFTQARSATGAEATVTRDADRVGLESLFADGVPDQTHWSESRVRAFAARMTEPAESQPLPAALLRIPRVELEVPVYADTSERNLNRGAGLVAGTALPDSDGNIAIAAHRDGYFRALEDVAVGDVVELASLSRERKYRVIDLSIVEPTDISPLRETDVPAITLVTCYPFYFVGNAPQRFIVRAVAVD